MSNDWVIPAWWDLKPFENGTFTLTRVDGVVLSSFQTRMGFWGWCVTEGEAPFLEHYGKEDAMIEEDAKGNVRYLPRVREAPFQYPDPAEFLPEVDRYYPLEA